MATAEELKKIYDTQAAGVGNPSTPVSGGSVGVAANGAQGNVGATLGAAAIPAAGAAGVMVNVSLCIRSYQCVLCCC